MMSSLPSRLAQGRIARLLSPRLEEAELLAGGTEDLVLLDLEDVEAHRLGKRAALADGQDVTLLRLEARGAVGHGVGVALLEALVLLDEVEVVAAQHHRAGHLARGDAHALQDAAADVHLARERALLVHVLALERLLRHREAKPDALRVPAELAVLREVLLRADEDVVLLLVSLLGLVHGCGTCGKHRVLEPK